MKSYALHTLQWGMVLGAQLGSGGNRFLLEAEEIPKVYPMAGRPRMATDWSQAFF